jgi:hypothetical protein
MKSEMGILRQHPIYDMPCKVIFVSKTFVYFLNYMNVMEQSTYELSIWGY